MSGFHFITNVARMSRIIIFSDDVENTVAKVTRVLCLLDSKQIMMRW